MLSDGFEEDVERILETSPLERQTLLFSATMPTWVKKLTRRFQKNPIMVDLVGDDNAGKMSEDIKCAPHSPNVVPKFSICRWVVQQSSLW